MVIDSKVKKGIDSFYRSKSDEWSVTDMGDMVTDFLIDKNIIKVDSSDEWSEWFEIVVDYLEEEWY